MNPYLESAKTFSKINRKPLMAVVAVLAVVLLIWGLNQRNSAPQAYKLAWKDGEVLFTATGAIWEFADVGTMLGSGASLKTSERSKAILQAPDGSAVRLMNGTEIKIDSLTRKGTLLTQLSGRSFHRVKKTDKALYQISALGNTIQAVGTAFDLSVNPTAKRINTKVLEGQVALTLANNEAAGPQKISKGNEVTVDAQTQILASLVGACPDYTKSDWFVWNKAEDAKLGYELRCDASVSPLSEEEPKAAVTDPTPAETQTPSSSAPKTTPSAPKPVSTYTGGTCKPYLTVKRGLNNLGIQLNWSTCNNDDFQFYKVVRSTTNPNVSYPSAPALVSSSNKFFGSYLDKNLAIGQTYYYRVCVVERLNQVGCGNVAKMSN